jgi:tetratricopeptide (TPR) repeat protein
MSQTRSMILVNIVSCVRHRKKCNSGTDYRMALAPDTTTQEHLLTLCLYLAQQTRETEAENLFLEILEDQAKFSGICTPMAVQVMNGLEKLYLDMGSLEKAEYLLHKYKDMQGLVSMHDSAKLHLSGCIGLLLLKKRELKAALRIFQRLIQTYTIVNEVNDVDVIWSLSQVGEILLRQDQLKEAREALSAAHEQSAIAYGARNQLTLDLKSKLARLYAMELEYPKAVQLYRRTIEGYEELFGPENSRTEASCRELGDVYRKMGKESQANQSYDAGKASPIRREENIDFTRSELDRNTRPPNSLHEAKEGQLTLWDLEFPVSNPQDESLSLEAWAFGMLVEIGCLEKGGMGEQQTWRSFQHVIALVKDALSARYTLLFLLLPMIGIYVALIL